MGLKEFRIKKGYTQEQLARLADIKLRTYQNIEKRNSTDIITARNISLMLASTIEEVFFDEKKE